MKLALNIVGIAAFAALVIAFWFFVFMGEAWTAAFRDAVISAVSSL